MTWAWVGELDELQGEMKVREGGRREGGREGGVLCYLSLSIWPYHRPVHTIPFLFLQAGRVFSGVFGGGDRLPSLLPLASWGRGWRLHR